MGSTTSALTSAISAGLALTAGVSASPALMVSATSTLTAAISAKLALTARVSASAALMFSASPVLMVSATSALTPAISAGLALTSGVSASPAKLRFRKNFQCLGTNGHPIAPKTLKTRHSKFLKGLIQQRSTQKYLFESQVFYKCGFGVFERYLEAWEH